MAKLVATVLLCGVCMLFGYYMRDWLGSEYVFTLEKPLRIVTDRKSDSYLLPPGTVLYRDNVPKEGGFDRYRVYVNVFGTPLKAVKSPVKGQIEPLTSFQDESDK